MTPTLDWLEDPRVFEVNRLPAHSDHHCYTSHEELSAKAESLRQSLDGVWQFAYSENPSKRPASFWQTDADLSGFAPITVPAHIELQGYGQLQYINTLYPWDGREYLRPPHISKENNPVGSYVCDFILEKGLENKPVCISFQGVEQAFYLWCNGNFVGYSEDSFTPADFDLSPFLQEGINRLCVEVYRHSSATWLEDQDFFRFFGIFRSVYLYAKPEVHVEDMWLQTNLLDDNTTGTIIPKITLSGAKENANILLQITDLLGNSIYDAPVTNGETISIENICPWSHEVPTLYHALLTIFNASGTVVELVPYDIGFRQFKLQDGIMLLNGERIVFNGVNRHEWNPNTGRAIGEDDMLRSMKTFKKNNINAVRTCHYPNQSSWYSLCDENGIYMIDEANLESHGTWQKMNQVEPSWNVPGSLPEWRDCVVDRARSMFERDKNHVSILLWSCGNESYAGEDILAMSDFFHENDPTRLVHYEGVFHCREFEQISDIESQMYTKPADIRNYLESNPKKPIIICEYMHNMGNSLGGMQSYIDLVDEFPQYQGGFVWDYMDQALWRTTTNGKHALGYGGDFGERPTDYAFCGNGIVFADGSEKPSMQELKYWYDTVENRNLHNKKNKDVADIYHKTIEQKRTSLLEKAETASPLIISEGDVDFGVRGDSFEVVFSYIEAGPISLISHGKEWLFRAPRPALWRATTENDKGCRFSIENSAWLAADILPQCTNYAVLEKTEKSASIQFSFGFSAVPNVSVDIIYTVDASGNLAIKAKYHGAKNAPQMPCFGIRFVTPEPANKLEWVGLSGETYPDRKLGATFGAQSEFIHIPDYLVPQDCGMHFDTYSATLCYQDSANKTTASLELLAGEKPFAVSALPYSAQELENAMHKEDLPPIVRTHVTVLSKVRGVGGIDSWGTPPESIYHISGEESHELSFSIVL